MSDLELWYQRWPSLFAEGSWYQLPDGMQVQARPRFKPDDKRWPLTWELYPADATSPAFSVVWETPSPAVLRYGSGGRLDWSGVSFEDIRPAKPRQ